MKAGMKSNFGMGAFPRPGHEPLLICRRGSLPFTDKRNVHSVQTWPQAYECNGGKKHSRKPDGALDLVEACSPPPLRRAVLSPSPSRLGLLGLGLRGG